MAHVVEHRKANGEIAPNVFNRVETEGDAARFYSAEAGQRLVIHIDSEETLDDETPIVTHEGGTTYLFQLPFQYLVGSRQLQVWIPEITAYAADKIVFTPIASVDERNVAAAGWTGPSASFFATWFEELSSSSVRIYGLDSPGIVMFVVPHTSLPAVNRNKVIVRDQGDNEAVELLGDGDGVIMRSPNGRRWILRIDDSGAPVIEPR
jgi:hypothetical protein